MKRFVTTLLVLVTLIYNQTLSAASTVVSIKPLDEMVKSYNRLVTSPQNALETLDEQGKTIYLEIIKKADVSKLPELVLVGRDVYQLNAGKDKVIFSYKNWKKKRFVINDFLIDFSKVSNVSQLLKTISQALSPQKSKVSRFIDAFRGVFISDVQAFEWGFNKETGLVAAAVIAAIGIGYLVYKNNKKDKKQPTPSGDVAPPIGTYNEPPPVPSIDILNVSEVDKSKYVYHGKVVSGEQFDVVAQNSKLHLVSDKYYQIDNNGKVVLSDNMGDGAQCGMCFPPAIAADETGSIYMVTRHDGGWNEGYDIKYRKRSSSGQWVAESIVGTRKKRNYVVGVAAPSESEVYITSTSAGEDVGGNVVFWKAIDGKTSALGEMSGIWRSDAGTKIRSFKGQIFFASGDPGPSGTAFYSYAKPGESVLNELKANMKKHQAGEGRRGVPDLYIDKTGDVHFSYGTKQTVYYNRYKQGVTPMFSSDMKLFENLGEAHLDGIGVSAVAASDDGNMVVVVAVHNQSGDILIRISNDQGKTFDEPKKLGVKSRVDETRLRPVVAAIENKFFIFYFDTTLQGIGLITTNF